MAKICYGDLYLRDESKQNKGSKQDSENLLQSPMSEGGEQVK